MFRCFPRFSELVTISPLHRAQFEYPSSEGPGGGLSSPPQTDSENLSHLGFGLQFCRWVHFATPLQEVLRRVRRAGPVPRVARPPSAQRETLSLIPARLVHAERMVLKRICFGLRAFKRLYYGGAYLDLGFTKGPAPSFFCPHLHPKGSHRPPPPCAQLKAAGCRSSHFNGHDKDFGASVFLPPLPSDFGF